MKYGNFFYKTFLLIIFITMSSCQDNRLRYEETTINDRVVNIPHHGNSQLILDTITGFEWDELLIVGPYVDVDTIANQSTYDLTILPESIKDFDKRILLGFIDNKIAVRYMVLNRTNFHDTVFIEKGREYRFYPRNKAQLYLREN